MPGRLVSGGGWGTASGIPPIPPTSIPCFPGMCPWGNAAEESSRISPVSPQKSPGSFLTWLGRFCIVMLRLPPLTPGFPPTRNKFGRVLPVLEFIPRSSPVKLRPGLGRFGDVTPRLFATAGFAPIRDRHGGLRPPWALPFAPVHPGCSLRLGRFGDVTPRLFATAGFAPIRDRHGGLRPPYAYPSLRSIQPAHDGSDASSSIGQTLNLIRFCPVTALSSSMVYKISSSPPCSPMALCTRRAVTTMDTPPKGIS